MTSPIRARERCPSDTASCLDIQSADQRSTRAPRATTRPTLPAHYGAGASVIAAQARASARPGNVPGHGESLPETWATQLVDHSREPKTNCEPVDTVVDEDCVDRELQLGKTTGNWTPGLNDCHSVVKRIIDKCHDEAVTKALEADTARRLKDADAGAP